MKIKALICGFLAGLTFFAAQAQDMTEDEIRERIKPLGKLHVAGAQAAVAGPRSGSDVYAKSCVACHGSGVLGAPKFQVGGDWSPRMEKGFDTVLANAINGFKAMPPKGGCSDCSDDEIKAAIEHMIEGI